ncbi:MAG TPA: AAA family ATPase, partial [Polyangiaceae bacterium]|nr:AAA family ATPase [Polyangiaceae bacterium]
MPVVARVREQSELQRALQRARSGVGGLVRVVGEPGIGKTTLVRALFELARSQDIRAGWARPWRGSPPFALVVDVLRSCHPSAAELVTALGKYASGLGTLFPELGGDSEGDRSKQSLFAALAGWLRSCEPTLLVLDDAHEADLASLECLTWLAPSLTGSRVLIVVSERSVGRDASPESEAYLSRWLRVSETLNLGPLDTRAVGQMLEWHSGNLSSSELHEKVTALTRGNPLFVEGVAHALEAG